MSNSRGGAQHLEGKTGKRGEVSRSARRENRESSVTQAEVHCVSV